MNLFGQRPPQERPREPREPKEGAREALEAAAVATTETERIDCLLRAVNFLADGDLPLYRLTRAVREARL